MYALANTYKQFFIKKNESSGADCAFSEHKLSTQEGVVINHSATKTHALSTAAKT